MPKMSTDPVRHALNGATMGTRWSAMFYADKAFNAAPVRAALAAAVAEVDTQMSTWKPDSDLMRLNAAPVDAWVNIPAPLIAVLALGLRIGRLSGGAFDIGMGQAVAAWGFGPDAASPEQIRKAIQSDCHPAHDLLELDAVNRLARKTAPLMLDLNGIAKGYGVDRLADVLASFGITSGLLGIDGEMRALGLRPDSNPWVVAIERPDYDRRTPHSILALQDAAIATSGDYRHWVDVQGRRLSHTMDPNRGAPLATSPASVTVLAETCAEADAWATALMVLGAKAGKDCAARLGLNALFLLRRNGGGIRELGVGDLFLAQTAAE